MIIKTCRRCPDCEGSEHHWWPDCPSDPSIPLYACEHCSMRGWGCHHCNEDGCEACDNEGVLPAGYMDLDVLDLLIDEDWQDNGMPF